MDTQSNHPGTDQPQSGPTAQEFESAKQLIMGAERILLVSHRRPDGDTLGASIALHRALLTLGKKPVSACIDPVASRMSFMESLLPTGTTFQRTFDYTQFDLIIISDAGAPNMTGFHELYPEFLSKQVPILNIDHHASNDGFGNVNIVDTKASSATIIVYRLLKYLNIQLDRQMAIALFTGIYNDTGGMMHSNTNQETFAVASHLLSFGFSIETVVRPLMKTSTISQLKLWGHVLENMRRNDRNIVSSVVTEDDLRKIHAQSGDTGGIIDIMSTVTDAQFTVLLAEENGMVKGSLRTQRDDVNLSDLAGQFGGGGHAKASGFRVPGKLEKQSVWKIVPADSEKQNVPLSRVSM